MKNNYHYTAQHFIDSTLVQNQKYELLFSENKKEYIETAIFLKDTTVEVKCRIQLIDNLYHEIEIFYKNKDLVKNVLVKKESKNTYKLYLNNVLKDSLKMKDNVHLFEGPNPTFDLINSKISSQENKLEVEIGVNQIDWFNGKFSVEQQSFQRDTNYYLIDKKASNRFAKIKVTDAPLEIVEYSQNTERYFFEKTN